MSITSYQVEQETVEIEFVDIFQMNFLAITVQLLVGYVRQTTDLLDV